MQVKREEIAHLQAQISESEKTNHDENALHREYRCLQQLAEHYGKILGKLTRAQRKDLCQLLIEQMILTRSKKGKKWNISGRIVMRFDLSSQNLILERGGTFQSSDRVHNGISVDNFKRSGATADTGYKKSDADANLRGRFVFDFRFEKWNKKKAQGEGGVLWRSRFVDIAD